MYKNVNIKKEIYYIIKNHAKYFVKGFFNGIGYTLGLILFHKIIKLVKISNQF